MGNTIKYRKPILARSTYLNMDKQIRREIDYRLGGSNYYVVTCFYGVILGSSILDKYIEYGNYREWKEIETIYSVSPSILRFEDREFVLEEIASKCNSWEEFIPNLKGRIIRYIEDLRFKDDEVTLKRVFSYVMWKFGIYGEEHLLREVEIVYNYKSPNSSLGRFVELNNDDDLCCALMSNYDFSADYRNVKSYALSIIHNLNDINVSDEELKYEPCCTFIALRRTYFVSDNRGLIHVNPFSSLSRKYGDSKHGLFGCWATVFDAATYQAGFYNRPTNKQRKLLQDKIISSGAKFVEEYLNTGKNLKISTYFNIIFPMIQGDEDYTHNLSESRFRDAVLTAINENNYVFIGDNSDWVADNFEELLVNLRKNEDNGN